MRLIGFGVCLALVAGIVTTAGSIQKRGSHMAAVDEAVDKAARWLASVQGADGGWGQDGGETVFNRNGERLESSGNDLANTAVAALALRRAGPKYQDNVSRALAFILNRIETSPAAGRYGL